MDDLTGQVIKTYELKEKIGEGGFGAVYRAHQKLIGREVAIKIILPRHANQPDFVRRFETEAQLVARLEHPYIVPLYDYWREPTGAYLVMRWLRGGSLEEHIKEVGSYSAREVSRILNQICEALIVAHRQGVIHRDLKTENILLDENGNAFLTDFGIAKDLGGNKITQNNAILGSPAYLSPEQIKGELVTPQSDIYSLGVVIYQMLTGSLPFDDASPATLMYRHLSEPLPDVNLADPDFPPAINAVLQRATAKDPSDRYEDALELARDFRRAVKTVDEETDPLSATETAFYSTSTGTIVAPDPENPYKGLRAFQQADSDDFFGREVLTLSIMRRIQEPVDTARFLAVVGPSGSGKSSVVKAGVLPELRAGAMPGSENWFIVEMLPGLDPYEELEAALLRIAVNPPDSLREQLMTDERGLLRAVKRVLPEDDSELLIFIDQFEELFTIVDEDDIRRSFMDCVRATTNDKHGRVRFIITLRADFYDKPLQYPEFGALMRERTEVVLPLNAEELERAISGPAKRVGLYMEDGLVTAIVADVKDQPGALPLLQYALTELFERREGQLLTLEAYNEIGGTLGALARRADELFQGLTDEGQEAARQLFLRLVTLGEGTEDTRRRVLQSTLLTIGEDADEMELVIDAFGRYRLLTFDHDPSTRSATVEVAHEALIRQWQLLRAWLDESREDLRIQTRLSALANEWINVNRDPSYLARGLRLSQFENWQEATKLALSDNEASFLEASIEERHKRDQAERIRQEREAELEKRSRERLQLLVSVMSVAAIIAIGLAVFAFSQQRAAQDARAEAELAADLEQEARAAAEANQRESESLRLAADARNQLIQHNDTLALLLALAADEADVRTPVEVLRVLATTTYSPGVRARFEGHTGAVLGGDISSDGRLTVSASADGSLIIWNNKTREFNSNIVNSERIFTSAVFNAQATQLLAGADDAVIYLYDLASGEIVSTFAGHTDVITSVVFSADGTQILSGSFDRTMRLWDVATGETIRVFENDTGIVFDVAFAPDGSFVVSGHGDEFIAQNPPEGAERDRRVRVWDVETGRVRITFDPMSDASGWVRSVAISPDQEYILAAMWDSNVGGVIRVWEADSGLEARRLFGHSDLVTSVNVTPDSTRVVTSSWDRTVRVWDITTGIEEDRFEVFSDRLQDTAISQSGEYVSAFSGDIGGNEIQKERDQSSDTSVWLIDLENRTQTDVFRGHQDWAWSVAVHPSGDFVVSGSGPLSPQNTDTFESRIRLWNVNTTEEIFHSDVHSSTVEGLAFSSDGSNMVSGAWDGQIVLWRFDPDADEQLSAVWVADYPAPDVEAARVLNVAFSPDDTIIAASANDGTIALYRAEDGTLITQFGDHTNQVAGISFSPDGSRLATSSWDNTAAVWDVGTGERLVTLEGHTDWVNDIAFSPDGRTLLTGSWDATVRLWNAETGNTIQTFVGHSNRVQTVAFDSTGTYALSGGADTTLRLWSLETGQEIIQYNNHTNWVSQAAFLPGDAFAISSGQDRTLRRWIIPSSPEQVKEWASQERYIRDLTCEERDQFRVPPFCDSSEVAVLVE